MYGGVPNGAFLRGQMDVSMASFPFPSAAYSSRLIYTSVAAAGGEAEVTLVSSLFVESWCQDSCRETFAR